MCLNIRWFNMKWLMVFMVLLNTSVFAEEEKVLNIYNWANAMPDSVLQKFEKETGIHIRYSTYISNEMMFAKLKTNPKAGYDVVFPSTYFVERLRKQGMIQKLNKEKLPNLNNIDPQFMNLNHDPKSEYSVPYLWGATGICVNNKYFDTKAVSSWIQLWDPIYKGHVLLLDDTRDTFSIGLLALNYSPNDTKPKHIEQAYLKLKDLLPSVKTFNTAAQGTLFVNEEVTIGMCWNGLAYTTHAENPSVQFIYPKEGFVISLDSMVIPIGAKHVENAHRFIDFISRPEIASELSTAVGFPTPNVEGMKLQPDDVKNNRTIYPDPDTLKRGSIQTDVGENVGIYEKYFQELKLQSGQ